MVTSGDRVAEMSLRSRIGTIWLGRWIVQPLRLEGDGVLLCFCISVPVLGVDMVDSLPLSLVLSNSFSTWMEGTTWTGPVPMGDQRTQVILSAGASSYPMYTLNYTYKYT